MQLQAWCRPVAGDWEEVGDLTALAELRRDPKTLVMAQADVSGADLRGLAVEFGLDPLALEDAMNPRQRPKLDSFEGHFLLVLYQLDEVEDQLEPTQVASFVGEDFVLVLHHGADRLMEEFRRRLDEARSEDFGTDRLVHLLVDAAVDDYEEITARLAEEVEALEEKALAVAKARESDEDDPIPEMPSQYVLYTLKQNVSMLRRFAIPASQALERALSLDDPRILGPDTEPLLRDVHDHTIRIEAHVRSIEELLQGVLDLTQSVQADMLNEINKKLTGWAAIIAAPALIVGLYGINYTLLPKPSIGAWGFVIVVTLMAMTSASLFLFFKRKDWI